MKLQSLIAAFEEHFKVECTFATVTYYGFVICFDTPEDATLNILYCKGLQEIIVEIETYEQGYKCLITVEDIQAFVKQYVEEHTL